MNVLSDSLSIGASSTFWVKQYENCNICHNHGKTYCGSQGYKKLIFIVFLNINIYKFRVLKIIVYWDLWQAGRAKWKGKINIEQNIE